MIPSPADNNQTVPLRFRWERAVNNPESTLSSTARHLALLLASFGNVDGTRIYPSVSTLAKQMGGVSDRTVQRALRELSDAGLLRVIPRPQHTSVYELLVPADSRPVLHVVKANPDTGVTPTPTPVSPDQTKDQTIREEGACLVDSLVDLVVGVNRSEAKRVKRSPEVAEHARRAAANGYGKADLVAAWSERPPKVIHGGPDLAVALLDRLGTRLPPTRQRSGRRRSVFGIAPTPASAFDKYKGGGIRTWDGEVMAAP